MKDQEHPKKKGSWGSQERQEEKKETKPQVGREKERKGKERKGRKRECWGQELCWVVTQFGKLEPPNTGQEAKGEGKKNPQR